MGKVTKIVLVAFLLIAIIVFSIGIRVGKETADESELPKTPDAVQDDYDPFNLIFEEVPEGDTIEIADVEVNNFFEKVGIPESASYIIIEKNSDYKIAYLNNFNSFLISITNSPFESQRILAEEKFLDELGISETDACKLEVQVTTPRFANPDHAGIIYGLSFCE